MGMRVMMMRAAAVRRMKKTPTITGGHQSPLLEIFPTSNDLKLTGLRAWIGWSSDLKLLIVLILRFDTKALPSIYIQICRFGKICLVS